MNLTNYQSRILLVATGLSPQVVTETLYALAVDRKDPWIPTKVHLITTEEGAQRVRLSLLNPQQGHFHRLIQEYKLPEIDFSMETVHVIRDSSGQPLDDIRSEQDNRCCADTITNIVRDLTADPASALHVSIAGGRKTMGYYLGYALSLYGRSQDQLSHVLVNVPYESHPDFYYPTRESRLIHTRGDRPRAYDTKEAQISLADIPFVRLRDGVPPSLVGGKASFSQTVIAAQRALGPSELIIDLDNKRLSASGVIIDNIPSADLAFYSWMARRCLDGSGPIRPDDDSEGLAKEFLNEYARLVGEHGGDYENAQQSLSKGMSDDDFNYRMSRTKKVLKDNLPPQLLEKYRVAGFGKRPQTRYGLHLDSGNIQYASILPDQVIGTENQ